MEIIPLVDLKAQYLTIKPEIDAAIQRTIDNASFILGSEVLEFEKEFAQFIGSKYAVGVASGTAAIQLALMACGIGPGDEVITTALSFFATAEAITNAGARPVFVDIDPKTYNIDPDQVEDAITEKTRVILPVHLYGQPCDLDALFEIANRRNIYLVEDAAQAHAAEYKGMRCGSIGHLACFSYYPGKNLGAYGDAGAVTGSDEVLIQKVRKLRDHGRVSKYEHDEIGFGERMDALQAGILRAKLPHLIDWTNKRKMNADAYRKLLSQGEIILPFELPGVVHNYHQFVIKITNRDKLLAHLKSQGIEAGIHYPIPLHHQPAYMKLGYGNIRMPISESVVKNILSLPMYPELPMKSIDYICRVIKEFIRSDSPPTISGCSPTLI
jgi:dTDP-4-amino-4,6-dideoxygalactose transaminase